MSIGTKERYQSFMLLILLCIAIMFIVVYVVSNECEVTPDSELPSLMDIQRRLNELEPNDPIEVDGRYGLETQEKWERVYCNEQAKKYFEGTE